MTRNEFINKILSVLNRNNILTDNIKGSLLDGDIHFIYEQQLTFSDLDLMIKECSNPIGKADEISNEIYQLTGILVPVSIHSENSLTTLSLKESQELALLECIYQENTKKFKTSLLYRKYIFSKFALLLSRISAGETYKEIALRLNNINATAWYNVKLGKASALNSKITEWPKVNNNSLFWECFFQNNLTYKQAREFYVNVMNKSSLSSDLKTRINQKLDQVNFGYEK